MIEYTSILHLIILGMLLNNTMLYFFLGIDTLKEEYQSTRDILKTTVTLLILLPIISVISYLVFHNLMYQVNEVGEVTLDLTYIQTFVYAVIILVVSYVVILIVKTISQKLYQWISSKHQQLIVTTLLLGNVLININSVSSVLESFVFSVSVSIGYGIILWMLSKIHQQLEGAKIPVHYQGLPLQLIILSIMALIFSGFAI